MTAVTAAAVGTAAAVVSWLVAAGGGRQAGAGPVGTASKAKARSVASRGGAVDAAATPSADDLRLYALKAQAESDVRAGDRAAAAENYRRLFALAAERPPADPGACRAVLDAMAAADRLGPVEMPDAAAGEHRARDGEKGTSAASPTASPAVAIARPGRPTAGEAAATAPAEPVPAPRPTEDVADAGATPPPVPASAPATAPAEPLVRLDRPAGPPADDLDARVDQAIRRGAQWLLDVRAPDPGQSALAVYALAAAGQAVDDPRLSANGIVLESLLERLKATDLTWTYHRAIRACALAVHNRPKDRRALQADVYWLVEASSGVGNYTYGDRKNGSTFPGRRLPLPPGRSAAAVWDNSNSQYGLLGVWAGAEAGVEVPGEYWRQVAAHWRQTQCADGAWPYARGMTAGTFTMTCAGVVSSTIAHDYVRTDNALARFAAAPMPSDLANGLAWLDRSADDNARNLALDGYAAYGLERVGLATGIKYFGTHEWYREMAGQVIAAQGADGAWGRGGGMGANPTVNTAYAVLFLARGRHPMLVNKVRHSGDWYNRPRDAANVTRFVSRAIERPLNWQVVNLERPGTDWLDAPILYVSGAGPIKFAEADYARFRAYAESGGLIFLHADGSSAAFGKWARETFAAKVCPEAPMAPLPPAHGLFWVAAHLPPSVRLEGAGSGSRLWVILSPDDVAGAWQGRDEKTKRGSYDLMLNLFVYATDNVPPRNRLVTPVVPDVPADAPAATFAVARVRHGGDWDPEPGAWPRFAKLFRWQTGAAADVRAVTAEELGAASAIPPTEATRPAGSGDATAAATADVPPPPLSGRPALAHLTGRAPFALSDAEAAGLRAYVEAGGVLLVEACGGSGAFATFADETLLPTAFPGLVLEDAAADQAPLAKTQPVTDDLTKRKVRPYTLGQPAGRLVGLRKARWGKGWVLVSRYDLTTGLLGCNVWGVVGFSPNYAVGVVKNVLVWAATMRGADSPALPVGPRVATKP